MGTVESVLFYLMIYLSSYFLLKISKIANNTFASNILVILAILIPSLVFGVRHNVGTDFNNYEVIMNYTRIHSWNFNSYPSYVKVDSGFMFIVKVICSFSKYNWVCWSVIGLSICSFVYKGLLYYSQKQFNIEVAFFAFLAYFFSTGYNNVRQILAFSMVFCITHFIFENKKKYFVYLFLIATIHYSAIVCITLWFMWDHKNNIILSKKKFFFINTCLLLVFSLYLQIYRLLLQIPFLSFLRRYEYVLTSNIGRNRTFLFIVIVTAIFFPFINRLKKKNRYNLFFICMMFFNLIVAYGGLNNKVLYRLNVYFEMQYLILFSQLQYLFDKRSRAFVELGVILFWSLYFVLQFGVAGNCEIIPYKTIWR